MKNCKEAIIKINGEVTASYTRMDEESEEDFKDEVQKIKAYCVREAYHYCDSVKVEVIFK